MDRYRITLTRDGRAFGILDREVYDFCGLPDEEGTVHPLQWQSRASAQAWLTKCYIAWRAWEGSGAGVVPKGWRPRPPETSPFDPGVQFYR